MDGCYEVHDYDVPSLDISDTHRLPTVSAAAVLDELEHDATAFIPTGLPTLDRLLAGVDMDDPESHVSGGLLKGQLTEVWGPPGSGKTALGIQVAMNALEAGRRVTWVDAFHPVCSTRLESAHDFSARLRGWARAATSDADLETTSSLGYRDRFDHFTCPSLAHLIALLCRPTPRCIAPETGLIVIDSLSALVNQAYPRAPDVTRLARKLHGSNIADPSSRRPQALQYLAGALQKVAATRNMAVLILSQCATKMKTESAAVLIPAMNSSPWEQGISTRLALFRDWIWEGTSPTSVHLAGIQKQNGTQYRHDNVVAFRVEKGYLSEIQYDATQPPAATAATPSRKRKVSDTDFEVPDSDDEEFGWNDDEEEAAFPSTLDPQWQGSEDLLVRPDVEESGRHCKTNREIEERSLPTREGPPRTPDPE